MKRWWSGVAFVAVAGIAHAAGDDTCGAVRNDLFTILDRSQGKASAEELAPLIERCWAIYDRSEGEPEEFDALAEVLYLTNWSKGSGIDQAWREATGKLSESFRDDPRIAAYVMRMPGPSNLKREIEQFVADLEKNSTVVDVKAAVAYKKLLGPIDQADSLPEAGQAELKAALAALARDFGALKVAGGRGTYGELAKKTLYAMENLRIGGAAPEISGKDLDEVEFKLSDYRGKVVLLDFWGFW